MKKKMSMRVLAIVMTVAMMFGCMIPAFAANNEVVPKYFYEAKNGMTFDKISHPDTGLKQADGVVDYKGDGHNEPYVSGVSEIGMGDRGQSYSYASASYGDWVYINTMYGGLGVANILKIGMGGMSPEAAQAMMNVMYNGHLYVGEPDGKYAGAILFKFNVKTGETKILMSRDKDQMIPTFRSAVEYNGKLYFVGMVIDMAKLTPEEIQKGIAMQDGFPRVYEIDPANNDKITCVYDCIDTAEYRELVADRVFTSTRAIGTYGDSLVAAGLSTDGVYLVASNDPSKGQDSFKVIADMNDLFNYPAYHRTDVNGGGGIYQVCEYNGKLYVVVCTGTPKNANPEKGTLQPFAIIRGELKGSDPTDKNAWTWSVLAGDKKDGAKYPFGLDEERYSAGACTLQVYGDYLYIGDYNDVSSALQGIALRKSFKIQETNLEQSVNLYRMDKNENVEMIVGDPTKQFPNGGTSGLGSGYLTHMNQYTWQTVVYKDKMYVSTMDTTTLLEPLAQFTNGDFIGMSKEEFISQINYVKDLVAAMIPKKDAPASRAIISKDVLKELNKMNKCLDKMVKLYNTNKIEAFADQVVEFDAIFKGIEDKLPDSIKGMYKMIRDLLTKDNIVGIAKSIKYMRTSERGFDLYEITNKEDGTVDIKAVTTNGFGDPYNHGLRIFEETDNDFVIGTANPFYGTQIWRLRGMATDPVPSVPGEPATPQQIIKLFIQQIQRLIEFIK